MGLPSGRGRRGTLPVWALILGAFFWQGVDAHRLLSGLLQGAFAPHVLVVITLGQPHLLGRRAHEQRRDDAVDTADLYFTYTGSLITKLEYKFEDGTVEQTETFEYDANNSLIAYKLVVPDDQGGYGFRYSYEYNAGGTITGTKYIGDATTQEDLSLTETISFTDGEVSSIVTSTGSSYTYTYDTKNNPLRNVVGLSKIVFAGGEGNSSVYNLTREVVVNGSETNTYNYTYLYLPNNYPTQSTQDEGAGEYTTQYLYE